MKAHRWFIDYIGLIVPRCLRAEWRHEGEAGLRYRELLLTRLGQTELENQT